MLIYGYRRKSDEGADANTLLELKEASLAVTLQEIDQLVSFLNEAKRRFVAGHPVAGQAHAHYSMHAADWTDRESDLIVIYQSSKQ